MNRPRPILRLEDKLEGERTLLETLAHLSDRRLAWVAVAAALATHALVGVIPVPAGGPAPDRTVTRAVAWPAVSRWMPEIPAPVEPAAPGASATLAAPPPPAISMDALRGPEPILEPPAVGVRSAPSPREPEVPFGVPEPPPSSPPAEVKGTTTELVTIAPRPAPGGKVAPQYPVAARSLRLSGWVRLEVDVDASGAVGAVRVLEVERPGLGFEEAAVKAVQRWRFVPAIRGDVPVAGTTVVEVAFRW